MKAKTLGDKLLPAFNTPSGIPWGLLNLQRSGSFFSSDLSHLLSLLNVVAFQIHEPTANTKQFASPHILLFSFENDI